MDPVISVPHHGPSDYLVPRLLTEVLTTAKRALHCREEWVMLAVRLEDIMPLITVIRQNSSAGDLACTMWLTDLQGLLDRAKNVTNESMLDTRLGEKGKAGHLQKLSSLLLNIKSQIEKTVANANKLTLANASIESCDLVLEPEHKLFLSYSGAQRRLVADLRDDLMRRNRHSFFDTLRSSLPVGQKFPNLIFDAIKRCQVGVVVLSEEYFTSKWPMLELMAMVEESQKPDRRIVIIPVFYTISLSKCHNPHVQFKWEKHWDKVDTIINAEKWKSALKVILSTNGLVMEDGMLDGDLRGAIVEEVCKLVPLEPRLDSQVEENTRFCHEIFEMIYTRLCPTDMKSRVQLVGIYGMGGIGKTTICKALCDMVSTMYGDKVVLAELGSCSELEFLRKVLDALSDLDRDILNTLDIAMCHSYLRSHVSKNKAFLALDNLSNKSMQQAKSCLEANFGDGTVVLVTARSLHLLLHLGVLEDSCSEMPGLELEEALALFLGSAGLEKQEVDKYLVQECVELCYVPKRASSSLSSAGLYHPLALRVLGYHMHDLGRGTGRQRAFITKTYFTQLLQRLGAFNGA